MYRKISNTDAIITSDEIIGRIKDLLYYRQGFDSPYGKINEWASECPDDAKELELLLALRAECDGYDAWYDKGMILHNAKHFTIGTSVTVDFDGQVYYLTAI